MKSRKAPRGFRLHIGIFGRRNVGKSSLLNAITRQNVSLVSETAGTTTDPVEKPMELLPLGPVLFIDTAGVDDEGALGELRIAGTRRVIDRTDLGVIVTDGSWGTFEESLREEFIRRSVPVVAVFNKSDLEPPVEGLVERLGREGVRTVRTAAATGNGILDFRQALLDSVPAELLADPVVISDLVGAGELAVLVVPIDSEAPKGRLIQPQTLALRDLLDAGALALVTRDTELVQALERLNRPPRLVVTDSQAFSVVAAATPADIPLTSFSILFARLKGDLAILAEGAAAADRLRPGDRVLVAEVCAHHPTCDDIGRVKIPRWLNERVGGQLRFDTIQGHGLPEDLSVYRLVVHCGACMWNRRAMLSRMLHCRQAGVPITNYGMIIAHSLGIFERALAPFPEALKAWRGAKEGA